MDGVSALQTPSLRSPLSPAPTSAPPPPPGGGSSTNSRASYHQLQDNDYEDSSLFLSSDNHPDLDSPSVENCLSSSSSSSSSSFPRSLSRSRSPSSSSHHPHTQSRPPSPSDYTNITAAVTSPSASPSPSSSPSPSPSPASLSSSTAFSIRREVSLGDAAPVISSGLSSTSSVFSREEEEELAHPPPTLPKGPSPTLNNTTSITTASSPSNDDEGYIGPIEPKDLDRYPSGHTPVLPFRRSTPNPSSNFHDADESYNSKNNINHNNYHHHTPLANENSLVHSRLVSEPSVSLISFFPQLGHGRRAESMAVHPPLNRPPPLKLQPNGQNNISNLSTDVKQAKTPGKTITSFFSKKPSSSSSGIDSFNTELLDVDRPQRSSPVLPVMQNPPLSAKPVATPIDVSKANGAFHQSRSTPLSGTSFMTPGLPSKINELENELREICSELAGSIRREMELEDLVDKLQLEISSSDGHTRTSDYFSDSGTSSVRFNGDSSSRIEELEKFKRLAEQERAQLKVDFSQKWQDEWSSRTASESHIQILENQVQQLRRERVDISDYVSRNKELENTLEDTRRKLAEERHVKDNFEDLLTAVRVELEQLRNERDHMRDVVVPESQQYQRSVAEHSDVDELLGEIAALKVENASLAQLHGSKFTSIGLSRSNSMAKSSGLMGTGPLSRSGSEARPDRESRESLVERVKDTEEQRDALHQTLKSLLFRYAHQEREQGKRIKALELELENSEQLGPRTGLRYGREVYSLRNEIGHLRQRAEDALDQKWQCEKGLAGLKMDLDRAEQQTTSLRTLLQEHDIAVPDELAATHEGFAEVQATSSSLETAYEQLQEDIEYAGANIPHSPEEKQIATRAEALADHVRQQLNANGSLRGRLSNAIGQGEREQQLSAVRISELQNRLKELEDRLVSAQQQSEEEMAKHEEELAKMNEGHRAQLLRLNNGSKSPVMLSPRPPNSPFGSRSPRLDKTTSGDGIPLDEAVQRENLERKVKELEKALRDADFEMEEVISRMNRAQIDVAELQTDRDNALRQTRKLQNEIQSERQAFKTLMS